MVLEAEQVGLSSLDNELSEEELFEDDRLENPKPNHNFSKLYDEGIRLFTKEGIQDLERQIAKAPQPTLFQLRSLTGRIITSDISRIIDDLNAEGIFWEVETRFEMYQKYFWSGKSHNALQYACPLYAAVLEGRELTADINPQQLQKSYQERKELWEASTKCAELKQKLIESHIPQGTNKIVCFGLGALTRDLARDEVDPGNQAFRATTQHAAAVTMAEIMKQIFGYPIKLLAQDPSYDGSSKNVLQQEGFQIVEGHGGLGFLEVDEHCLVFTVACNVPVKQIVCDLARPAAMIWTPTRLSEVNNGKFTKRVTKSGSPMRIA